MLMINCENHVMGAVMNKFALGQHFNACSDVALAHTKPTISLLLSGLTRMDNPSFQPSITLVDPIRDVIAPLLVLHREKLNEREQACEIQMSRPGILVWADRDLLYEIVNNMLVHAMTQGNAKGKIMLKIVERGTEDEMALWYNGPTVNPDDLETMLEQPVGANDNLYLTRKMIRAHGGRLWVDTRPGMWVCFTFTLPRRTR
jgi:signal transduction histidine kinase